MNKKQKRFLRFFEEQEFNAMLDDNHYSKGRLYLSLEDDNWDDICFNVFAFDISLGNKIYLTCVSKVKELKKILKTLEYYE